MKSALILPSHAASVPAVLRRFLHGLSVYVLLAIMLPIAVGAGLSMSRGWAESWRSADWGSSGLLPEAGSVPEARVMILAARTGRWKSIFAEHMSIVLKPAGADRWTRYDVVGWGNPVRRDAYPADAFWYGNRPYVVMELSGAEAEALIPRVEESITRYPNGVRGSYTVWPGPNSNSFVAWVVRNTEGFNAELPPVAVGKDYLGGGFQAARAPSGTGISVSAWGIAGMTVALDEGFELNLLGTAIGIDPGDLAVKLPSIGKVSLFDLLRGD
ncbi:DUF3750 domain-containing protein [Aestuariivirga sp.]|uniref:DUF3750 domain-containing protein n=1 Tax=Aestuariivirga sp. TaxID=2650926 RepID=UPI0035938F26